MSELIGRLAITPYALRGLVRIVAEAGRLDGKQMVEVEYVGNHPHGYADGQAGAYFADDLTVIEPAADSYCRLCGWAGHHADLVYRDACYCPECYGENIGNIRFEDYRLPEGWVPF